MKKRYILYFILSLLPFLIFRSVEYLAWQDGRCDPRHRALVLGVCHLLTFLGMGITVSFTPIRNGRSFYWIIYAKRYGTPAAAG